MIKRVGNESAGMVTEYLKKEESINTTLLAYLEKYGFEKDFQACWLQLDDNSYKTIAVILKHFNNLYIYGDGYMFNNEELGVFAAFTGADIISGKMEILSDMALYLDEMVLEPSTHMVFRDETIFVKCTDVQKACPEDCAELSELIYSIPEFSRFYHSRMEIEQGIKRRMELGICRYFVLKKDGLVISQAYTTIESANYATIGGVVTRPEYRKQGMASLVVSCISRDILDSKKTPNLFYSNDEAGRVYSKLGFEATGDYAMLISPQYII
jgi:predicted GNAT family acetyltransferase